MPALCLLILLSGIMTKSLLVTYPFLLVPLFSVFLMLFLFPPCVNNYYISPNSLVIILLALLSYLGVLLYPIPPVIAFTNFTGSKFTLAYLFASSSLWHRLLGHPSNHVLRMLASSTPFWSSFNFSCNHCALAKSTRLSFSSYEHCYSAPFNLL